MTRNWLGALVCLCACSQIIDVEVGAGLGANCFRDEECQATSCLDGICTLSCGDSAGCPGGSVCSQGLCELPVFAGFIFPYPVSQDELAGTFDVARLQLETELPQVRTEAVDDAPLGADAAARAGTFVDLGASIVVASSPTHADALLSFAAERPDATVLAFAAPRVRENLVSFDVRGYQSYYLAGVAAARATTTKRLALIGSIPSPPVVSRINGFILGAQSIDAAIAVEVVWLDGWHDMGAAQNGETRERSETVLLVGRGADVVAHTLDNNISALTIGDLATKMGENVYAVAANGENACAGLPAGRCLGTAYYRWAPLLSSLVRGLSRGAPNGGFVLEGLRSSGADSAFGFSVGPGVSGGQALAAELDALRVKFASETGVGSVFDGPINSAQCELEIGSLPCIADGDRLSDGELARMCWLVDGAVSFDGNSDQPAVVPASCAAWAPP